MVVVRLVNMVILLAIVFGVIVFMTSSRNSSNDPRSPISQGKDAVLDIAGLANNSQ